jgi:type II secretory pathway component PulK
MIRATKRKNTSRGATLVAVLISFTLVAAAVTAMMVLFATQAKRTRSTLAGTQLRQLLLAAPPVALDELRRHGQTARDVTIHTPVKDATLTLHIQSKSNNNAEIHVTAKHQTTSATQTLTYAHTANNWKLQSTTLK